MSVFSDKEVEYLNSQKLGRLATVNKSGDPQIAPVTFRYNPETDTIYIGGLRIGSTKKWENAKQHPRVSFVVDDVLPPWKPRMIEIRAEVELKEDGGKQISSNFAPEVMSLHPVQIISFGIDGETRSNRKVGK